MNKGYIVKKDGVWVVAEYPYSHKYGYGEINPIHPDHINTVIENGSVKPEYQGEVEYEVAKKKDCICHTVKSVSECEHYYTPLCTRLTTYAIPKPIEGKADVWEEAITKAKDELIGRTYSDSVEYYENLLYILKQHYTLSETITVDKKEEPPFNPNVSLRNWD